MLRQRDLDRCVAEFHGFAALGDDELLFRRAKLLGGLHRDWRADDGRAGLSGNRADVRNMIEMRVRDEDRFGLRHVGRLEANLMAARRAVEIGVEQIDLALVGEFEIGIGEPADDDGVGLRRRQWPARHGGLVTVAGLRDIGGERARPRVRAALASPDNKCDFAMCSSKAATICRSPARPCSTPISSPRSPCATCIARP